MPTQISDDDMLPHALFLPLSAVSVSYQDLVESLMLVSLQYLEQQVVYRGIRSNKGREPSVSYIHLVLCLLMSPGP